ncbi:GntR family transcriptional regulator [Nonomuraea sp. LP-02]|uniref:GntR family transcriptional regulator n=1 Tax=Nonomuraea sp. LP-02 TaxID=3097960 RepID=UPI002E32AB68|nr:GntR family transcriptional regulator [Nonomuraea sp. LP-02]MED7925971.1 GntR family transcriptional regulator [Nonomuraea sp. LP-02]
MAKAERTYELIRDLLLSSAYEPGAKLTEASLAKAVGASRTPVREALRRLHSEGFIEWETNIGARLPEWRPEDLWDLFTIRAQLEGAVARRAAHRISDEEREHLADLAGRMEALAEEAEPGHLDRIAELNGQFHNAIMNAARNQRLSSLLTAVVQVPLVYRTFRQYDKDSLSRSMAHHRELLVAFAGRDGEWAQSIMQSHIFSARSTLMSIGAARNPDPDDE